eukprot:gene14695-20734_t
MDADLCLQKAVDRHGYGNNDADKSDKDYANAFTPEKWWSMEADLCLLEAVDRHGYGNYDAARSDKNYAHAFTPDNTEGKQAELESGADDGGDEGDTKKGVGKGRRTPPTKGWPMAEVLTKRFRRLLDLITRAVNIEAGLEDSPAVAVSKAEAKAAAKAAKAVKIQVKVGPYVGQNGVVLLRGVCCARRAPKAVAESEAKAAAKAAKAVKIHAKSDTWSRKDRLQLVRVLMTWGLPEPELPPPEDPERVAAAAECLTSTVIAAVASASGDSLWNLLRNNCPVLANKSENSMARVYADIVNEMAELSKTAAANKKMARLGNQDQNAMDGMSHPDSCSCVICNNKRKKVARRQALARGSDGGPWSPDTGGEGEGPEEGEPVDQDMADAANDQEMADAANDQEMADAANEAHGDGDDEQRNVSAGAGTGAYSKDGDGDGHTQGLKLEPGADADGEGGEGGDGKNHPGGFIPKQKEKGSAAQVLSAHSVMLLKERLQMLRAFQMSQIALTSNWCGDKALIKKGDEYPSWWSRNHDMDLVKGVLAHGFGNWAEIMADESLSFAAEMAAGKVGSHAAAHADVKTEDQTAVKEEALSDAHEDAQGDAEGNAPLAAMPDPKSLIKRCRAISTVIRRLIKRDKAIREGHLVPRSGKGGGLVPSPGYESADFIYGDMDADDGGDDEDDGSGDEKKKGKRKMKRGGSARVGKGKDEKPAKERKKCGAEVDEELKQEALRIAMETMASVAAAPEKPRAKKAKVEKDPDTKPKEKAVEKAVDTSASKPPKPPRTTREVRARKATAMEIAMSVFQDCALSHQKAKASGNDATDPDEATDGDEEATDGEEGNEDAGEGMDGDESTGEDEATDDGESDEDANGEENKVLGGEPVSSFPSGEGDEDTDVGDVDDTEVEEEPETDEEKEEPPKAAVVATSVPQDVKGISGKDMDKDALAALAASIALECGAANTKAIAKTKVIAKLKAAAKTKAAVVVAPVLQDVKSISGKDMDKDALAALAASIALECGAAKTKAIAKTKAAAKPKAAVVVAPVSQDVKGVSGKDMDKEALAALAASIAAECAAKSKAAVKPKAAVIVAPVPEDVKGVGGKDTNKEALAALAASIAAECAAKTKK